MCAGDRTEGEIDFEGLALLKMLREKQLEETVDCHVEQTLTQHAHGQLVQLFACLQNYIKI